MRSHSEFDSLCSLLDKIHEHSRQQDVISIRDILKLVGRRWYGPLLIVAGMVMMTPVIGDIPGVPVIMGATVILISCQLLLRNKKVWLPLWILERKVDSDKVVTAIKWARGPSKFVDKFTRSRFSWVVKHAGLTIIALMSIMVAAVTPILELIPFSATLAGFAITAFGVSVLATDGLVALVAIGFSVVTLGLGGSFLF